MENTLEMLIPLLAIVGGLALPFGIVYVNRTAKNKEKLAMLEKGFTPEEIADSFVQRESKAGTLSNGLMFVGAGTGILIGFFLTQISPIDPTLAYITCGFLFGGVGLVIAHFFQQKKED